MLWWGKLGVHSENVMNLTRTLSGQNSEVFSVKAGGTYTNQCVFGVSTASVK
jgi:hypothetical protein